LAKRYEIGQNGAAGLPRSITTWIMDQKTLDSLHTALAASPENLPLLKVLMAAYLERDEPETAVALLEARTPADLPGVEERLLAARACLAAGHPERALGFAAGDSAAAKMLQARCLLALERNADGLRCYQAAVAANPTLESPALRDRLQAVVRTFPTRERRERGGDAAADSETPHLRVIANDDTLSLETDRLLAPALAPVTFADVGGLDDLKQQIHRRIVLPFQKPSLFQRFKKRVGGGILLYGAPGCGKTLLARATAGECKAAFYNVAIADILDMYIGESERKLHAIFERARQSAPAVLFFDELEALGGKRQFTREATSAKLVSQFLSEMDGFAQNNSGVLILGATNVPWAIDPAFRRPGRFDRVLFVPPPDRPAREAILGLLLRDRPLAAPADDDPAAALDLAALSRRTSGFSGADLQELVETAADEAIAASLDRGEETPISAAHLRSALGQVKPTTLEWLTTARNYARYANEAGQYDEVLAFLDKHGRR
jgi:transitional endoplasmic reticulum ATPase